MPAQLVDRDREHLWLLSILHYCAAGVTAFVGSFPLIHVAIGTFLTFMPDSMRGTGKDAFPREVGVMFMGLGLVFVAAGWGLAAAHFMTAKFLKRRRHFVFCAAASVVTCFACMFSSGIISIATLIVLFRPGVRELFDQPQVAEEASVP